MRVVNSSTSLILSFIQIKMPEVLLATGNFCFLLNKNASRIGTMVIAARNEPISVAVIVMVSGRRTCCG